MSQPAAKASDELSMEEILASIRNAISEDNVPGGSPRVPERNDDVLELTELVNEHEGAEKMNGKHKSEPKAHTLIESAVLQEAAAALGSLNQAFGKKDADYRRLSMSGPFGQQTVEELVKEMLKPLLKEWLDANLPSLVKWIVTEQIEKIVRESTGYNR